MPRQSFGGPAEACRGVGESREGAQPATMAPARRAAPTLPRMAALRSLATARGSTSRT